MLPLTGISTVAPPPDIAVDGESALPVARRPPATLDAVLLVTGPPAACITTGGEPPTTVGGIALPTLVPEKTGTFPPLPVKPLLAMTTPAEALPAGEGTPDDTVVAAPGVPVNTTPLVTPADPGVFCTGDGVKPVDLPPAQVNTVPAECTPPVLVPGFCERGKPGVP